MIIINNKVDISSILNFLNITLLVLTIIWFFNTDENPYVDYRVLIATVPVHLQLSYFLKYEKKNTNPFLVILVIVVLIFYLLRIFTLLADEFRYSITFRREGGEYIGSEEILHFLIYLHLCLWAIFFGLITGNKKKSIINFYSSKYIISWVKYLNLLYISLISLIYFLYASFLIDTDSVAGLATGLFSGFLNYEIFVMLLTILAFYYRDQVPRFYSNTALIMVIMFFFIKVLNGGSGPMLRIGFPFFFTLLMIRGRIKIKLSMLLIMLVLVSTTSIFGTFLKFSNQKISFELISNFQTLENEQFRIIFSQIAARSAFLDFSVELINNPQYDRVINLPRYGKSVVDSFTPGFDIFDEPLTAYALRIVYLPSFPSKPTRRYVAENYHSDQLNVFSEYYILFGQVGSLFLLFISGYFFKRIYNYFILRVSNKILGLLAAAILLNLFWAWLRSFGLDFIIAEMPSLVYPVILIYFALKVTANKVEQTDKSSIDPVLQIN
jgi:hypothetical protein